MPRDTPPHRNPPPRAIREIGSAAYLVAALAIPAAVFTLAAAILDWHGALSTPLRNTVALIGAALALVAVIFEKLANRDRTVIVSTLVLSLLVAGGLVWAGTASNAGVTASRDPNRHGAQVVGFVGGCKKPYAIWGQNRWQPYGAKILARPYRAGKQIGSVAPNKTVYTDGWVETELTNLTNPPPWNKDVWFHLADGSGWVGFAGVRGGPTSNDPSGGYSNYGGPQPPTPAACHGAVS